METINKLDNQDPLGVTLIINGENLREAIAQRERIEARARAVPLSERITELKFQDGRFVMLQWTDKDSESGTFYGREIERDSTDSGDRAIWEKAIRELSGF